MKAMAKKTSMHADKCHSAYMCRKSKMQKSNEKTNRKTILLHFHWWFESLLNVINHWNC